MLGSFYAQRKCADISDQFFSSSANYLISSRNSVQSILFTNVRLTGESPFLAYLIDFSVSLFFEYILLV